MNAKLVGGLLGMAVAAAAGQSVSPAPAVRTGPLPSPEAGRPLYELHCLACHGEKGRGDGKAAVLLYPKPRDFTRGLFKIRTTPSGSLPTDQDLFDTLGRGMPGTAMPAFSALSDRERWALVSYLKTLVEAYEYRQPEAPVRVGAAPPKTARTLALGKKMYDKMECFACHGKTGLGDGPSAAELRDDWDVPIKVRDFTDGTYRGGPTDRDLYLRFTTGMTGTPMPAYSGDKMTVSERWALVHYVQSLRRPGRPAITPPANGLLVVPRVGGALPDDPFDAAWKGMPAVSIPLSPLWQRPGAVSHVSLRAMYNEQEIAFLLEWQEPRPETAFSKTEEFRDAAAIQFALPSEKPLTFLGMGHGQGRVNIWHWKSDWQAQLAQAALTYPGMHSDFYPFEAGFLTGQQAGNAFSAAAHATPVENLVAVGFGTLTPQPEQPVAGRGLWSDGSWHVVFRRTLKAPGQHDVDFVPGATVPFALACWQGAQGDRDGQKMVSTWYRLRLQKEKKARR